MVHYRQRLAVLLAVAFGAAACSHSAPTRLGATSATTTSTAPTTAAPTTVPPPTTVANVYPLTGLAIDDPRRAARPALIVKIENEAAARPQSGLQAADVVYEELIEGGDTRFVAMFQSADADPIGPIRSVRPTDPDLVAPIGGLFAYSGGTTKFVAALHATPVVDVGDTAVPGAYFDRLDRASPHRLYSSTARLYAASAAPAKTPPALFPFLRPGAPFDAPGASAATTLEATVGTQRVTYDWDPAAGWRRSIGGRPHVVEGGAQLTATNVIVQAVNWEVSPGDFDAAHSPVYVAKLVGSGDAWIFSGGKVVRGRWSKASTSAITTYTGPDSQPVGLPPGRTWVELSGADHPPTFK